MAGRGEHTHWGDKPPQRPLPPLRLLSGCLRGLLSQAVVEPHLHDVQTLIEEVYVAEVAQVHHEV
eukprot:CAMPEP_0173193628 /NCGR_PEP_ID=MMETSP1141-20130122/14056_1 /TAXON_ID=483371 /ORGANISM="non described non described, Strain CCMP2298" /LENGTH=64 /DNA_ID=CAMNT_0014117969 /DNA_START=247 /DNA_END=441 /DNA_ORIENTATION=+